MDVIREQSKNPLVVGIVAFIVGLIIGLVVLGWWLWPVQYVGAGPKDLTETAKVEYLRTVIQAYGFNHDASTAQARYQALGDDAPTILQEVAGNPAGIPATLITDFSGAVAAAPSVIPTAPAGTETVPTQATAQPARRSFLSSVLPLLCLVVLILMAAFIVLFIMRGRTGTGGPPTPAMQAQQAARQAAYTDYGATGAEPPMAQFMASYKLGDDLFDDSFSIDSPAGEFMGECGVGISETIGVGEPKKVTAFEVWLFDKNDIQTVTKVMMSAHAYADEATRQRLEAKGEPVLIEPGTETVLETQTLQMVARVVDVGYGDGALPDESFFDRFIVELAVWQRA